MNTVEKRRARWQQICQEYRASGMTLGTFCKQRGIARSTLTYWLSPIADVSPEADTDQGNHRGLIEVGSVSVGTQSVLRLRIGDNLVAELELPSDESVIRSVLRAARSV